MKTIFCQLILFFGFPVLLIAHNEFYKRSSPGSCTQIVVTQTNNIGILKWENYLNIPIAADWTLDFPFEIFVSDVELDFETAVAAWNLETDAEFNLQTWGTNVHVRFINSTVIFPNPNAAYAGTYHKFEEINGVDYIRTNTSTCPDYGTHTAIYLNNTTGRQFTWRTDDYIPPQVFKQITFQYTVAHELGHVLGLAHCSYTYPETIMNATPPWDNFAAGAPAPKDKNGIQILTDQNPGTPLEVNRLLNKRHAFFEYEPEILLYSQKQTENKKNDKGNSEPNTSFNTGKKLFTIPENKLEGVKK